MVNNEEKCETTGVVFTKFRQSNYWENNKFCQLSCFKSNDGCEGDYCCDNQTPVPCNICNNEETPWMKASSNNLLIKKWKFSTTWANGNFYQNSCFEEGNGYDNTNCCESSKTPTETTTNHPSYFQLNKPSPLLGSVPSKVSTYELTLIPSLETSKEPSGEPSVDPSIIPSSVPSISLPPCIGNDCLKRNDRSCENVLEYLDCGNEYDFNYFIFKSDQMCSKCGKCAYADNNGADDDGVDDNGSYDNGSDDNGSGAVRADNDGAGGDGADNNRADK